MAPIFTGSKFGFGSSLSLLEQPYGIGFLLNSNLGTTGSGVYYATSTVGGKRVDWFTFNSSASNITSQLSAKGITATSCYRVTTDFQTVVMANIPSGAEMLSWGAAGRSDVTTSGWSARNGGPGGYAKGTLSSTLSMATIIVGQGGVSVDNTMSGWGYGFGGGGYDSARTYSARGGGFSGIFNGQIDYSNYLTAPADNPFGGGLSIADAQSAAVILAGGGGCSGGNYGNASVGNYGGVGGGSSGGNGGIASSGTGGTQVAGGNTGGSAFLGGESGAVNQNHGITCGGGGFYGGGGAQAAGPYNYPAAGGGSGFVNGSFLTSTTLSASTSDTQPPPNIASSYYFGNYGYANLTVSIPQPSTVTSTYTGDGQHGLIAIVYP